jgi:hypothetical protein
MKDDLKSNISASVLTIDGSGYSTSLNSALYSSFSFFVDTVLVDELGVTAAATVTLQQSSNNSSFTTASSLLGNTVSSSITTSGKTRIDVTNLQAHYYRLATTITGTSSTIVAMAVMKLRSVSV